MANDIEGIELCTQHRSEISLQLRCLQIERKLDARSKIILSFLHLF